MADDMNNAEIEMEENPQKNDTLDISVNTSSSDEESGDSSTDADDANEAELKTKCQSLQNQIQLNPYMYGNHVELINTLKELGDLDELRKARQKMSELFPLSEDLWLDWLHDEVSLLTDESGREEVTKLFEKAVKDYLSIPIWLEYVQFSIGGMGQENGVKIIREVFERALTAGGLHVMKGDNLWEAYREFENALLAGLMPAPGAVPTKEQESQFNEQHNRVQALFKRQLHVPLDDMEETYKEYEDWLQAEPDSYTKQMYKKALAKLEKVRPYEIKLASARPPRLEEYQEYWSYEEKEGDPSRIQCLFERALQENCLISSVWLQYTKYLDHVLRVSTVSMDVYERSIRNCPWCVQIWQNYILILERTGEPYEKVKRVFEMALTSGFSQGSEYLSLWTTFINYLRRRIKWEQDHADDLETFRLSIEKSIEQMDSYGAEGDPNATLRQFWAFIEAKFCKNLIKSRELWAEIMAAGRANEAALWMENYRFERMYGDNKHCRKILQRALNSVTDWPEAIVEAYINFESQEGTLEQYEQAVSKCEAQMARIKERQEKAETMDGDQKKKIDKKGQKGKQRQNKFSQEEPSSKQKYPKKNKFQKVEKTSHQQPEDISEIKPYKRKCTQDDSLETPDSQSFKIPASIPIKSARSVPSSGSNNKDQSIALEGQTELKDHTETTASLAALKGEGDGLGTMEPSAKKSKREQSAEATHVFENSKEQLTVFISNLSYDIDEEKIRAFFTKCGQIEEIRLIKTYTGKSKGYAYVQFTDQLAVASALTYDRTIVDGRPMFVSKYEDRSVKPKADFKYGTSLEKNKLFVKNLPFSCTKEALETLFSLHGQLKEVRLVTYRNGASKGLAYVEYYNEQSAAQAVLKTDGIMIGDNAISVAISNPPARKSPMSERDETSFVPSLGGGKKETQNRGVARTQVMLMPRSVTKKPLQTTKVESSAVTPDNSAGAATASDSKRAGLSNKEFRDMLFK